jgi:hypothetical protein
MTKKADVDPAVTPDGLRRRARDYAADRDPADDRISPVFAASPATAGATYAARTINQIEAAVPGVAGVRDVRSHLTAAAAQPDAGSGAGDDPGHRPRNTN